MAQHKGEEEDVYSMEVPQISKKVKKAYKLSRPGGGGDEEEKEKAHELGIFLADLTFFDLASSMVTDGGKLQVLYVGLCGHVDQLRACFPFATIDHVSFVDCMSGEPDRLVGVPDDSNGNNVRVFITHSPAVMSRFVQPSYTYENWDMCVLPVVPGGMQLDGVVSAVPLDYRRFVCVSTVDPDLVCAGSSGNRVVHDVPAMEAWAAELLRRSDEVAKVSTEDTLMQDLLPRSKRNPGWAERNVMSVASISPGTRECTYGQMLQRAIVVRHCAQMAAAQARLGVDLLPNWVGISLQAVKLFRTLG